MDSDPALLPTEDFGTEMVTIHVGNERKPFAVHKNIICTIDFFRAAFQSGFKESEANVMEMPAVASYVFALVVHWLYRSSLPAGQDLAYVDKLIDLYVLSEYLCLTQLTDTTMDKIQLVCKTSDLFIPFSMVCKVYETTRLESQLKDFCARLICFQARSIVFEEVPGDAKWKSFTNHLHEQMHAQPDILNDVLLLLVDPHANILNLPDPRHRDSADPRHCCLFHAHDTDHPCADSQNIPRRCRYDIDLLCQILRMGES